MLKWLIGALRFSWMASNSYETCRGFLIQTRQTFHGLFLHIAGNLFNKFQKLVWSPVLPSNFDTCLYHDPNSIVVSMNRGDKNWIKHSLPSGRLFLTFVTKNGESMSSPDPRLIYTAHSSGGRGLDIYHCRVAKMIYSGSMPHAHDYFVQLNSVWSEALRPRVDSVASCAWDALHYLSLEIILKYNSKTASQYFCFHVCSEHT